MTDRELLEFAARAAGYAKAEFQDISGWGEVRYGLSEAMYVPEMENYWNPLKSDGDAFRLAIKLGILFSPRLNHQIALTRLLNADQDEYSIMRRAIVQMAAEIGRGVE